MRMMMRATLDTEASQKVVEAGRMGQVVGELLERMKPEAIYFGIDHGARTVYAFFDLADASAMPPIFEPLFGELGADITVTPMMTLEDLQAGLTQLAG